MPFSETIYRRPPHTRLQQLMSVPLDPPRYLCNVCQGVVEPGRSEEHFCKGSCKGMTVRMMTEDDRLNLSLHIWQKEGHAKGGEGLNDTDPLC